MPELKASAVTEVERPKVPAEEMVYLTIPAEDLYDNKHPGVRLIGGSIKRWNEDRGCWVDTGKAGTSLSFEAGKTYQLPAAIAEEVQQRLDLFDREDRRLLRPKADNRSLNQVNKGSMWAKGSVTSGESFDGAVAKEPGKAFTPTVLSWSK
jgi:hypothetical protein